MWAPRPHPKRLRGRCDGPGEWPCVTAWWAWPVHLLLRGWRHHSTSILRLGAALPFGRGLRTTRGSVPVLRVILSWSLPSVPAAGTQSRPPQTPVERKVEGQSLPLGGGPGAPGLGAADHLGTSLSPATKASAASLWVRPALLWVSPGSACCGLPGEPAGLREQEPSRGRGRGVTAVLKSGRTQGVCASTPGAERRPERPCPASARLAVARVGPTRSHHSFPALWTLGNLP